MVKDCADRIDARAEQRSRRRVPSTATARAAHVGWRVNIAPRRDASTSASREAGAVPMTRPK